MHTADKASFAGALIDRRYALVCCAGDLSQANNTLKQLQQEQVLFERNTIWKDMVGQERRAATVHLQVSAADYVDWFAWPLGANHTFRGCMWCYAEGSETVRFGSLDMLTNGRLDAQNLPFAAGAVV
jgi:hypothetical protein